MNAMPDAAARSYH